MLIFRRRYSGLVLLSLALLAAPGLGQNQPAGTLDFKRDIEPIFSQRCHHCHGSAEAAGGLRLDLRESALKGGSSGPAIVPGDSSASRLIDLVSGTGGMIMPLQGDPLSADLVDRLRAWIDQGAPLARGEFRRRRRPAGGRERTLVVPGNRRPGSPQGGKAGLDSESHRFVRAGSPGKTGTSALPPGLRGRRWSAGCTWICWDSLPLRPRWRRS